MPKRFCGIWGDLRSIMARLIQVAIIGGFWVPAIARSEFYTFQENTPASWQSPAEIFTEVGRTTYDLLHWLTNEGSRPVATERYNRLQHFGTWVDDRRTKECYDTRALVLMRDSHITVTMSSSAPCKVYAGQWLDPYGGYSYDLAREVEIDHVVALKNAYDSGAWGWDYQRRCLYANFMGYDKHLLAVASVENKVKSDKGPEAWLPSDRAYICEHLQNWLAVKFIWNLNMTQAEADAITTQVQHYGCDVKTYQFSKSEVSRVRRFAQANLELCSSR